eukprot:4557048-Amphidinium_carterae.1
MLRRSVTWFCDCQRCAMETCRSSIATPSLERARRAVTITNIFWKLVTGHKCPQRIVNCNPKCFMTNSLQAERMIPNLTV